MVSTVRVACSLTRSRHARRRKVRYAVRMKILIVATLALGSCNSNGVSSGDSPCLTVCNKLNACKATAGQMTVPCAQLCAYGGNIAPGLAPTPNCSTLDAQKSCVAAAVQKSCDQYLAAVEACPLCPVLDGSGCTTDADCSKYVPGYQCDVRRAGGYCTKACQQVDSDCSAVGPEACAVGAAPSFDTQAPAGQKWCLLGCRSDGDCRAAEGYHCLRVDASSGFGVCDVQ